MSALYCSQCGYYWPVDYMAYQTCPVCARATVHIMMAYPLEATEAAKLVGRLRFARFLAEETEGARDQRQKEYEDEQSATINRQFEEVVARGAFTEQDRADFDDLNDQLAELDPEE